MTQEQLYVVLAHDLRNALEDAAVRATQLSELGFHVSARVERWEKMPGVADIFRSVVSIVQGDEP